MVTLCWVCGCLLPPALLPPVWVVIMVSKIWHKHLWNIFFIFCVALYHASSSRGAERATFHKLVVLKKQTSTQHTIKCVTHSKHHYKKMHYSHAAQKSVLKSHLLTSWCSWIGSFGIRALRTNFLIMWCLVMCHDILWCSGILFYVLCCSRIEMFYFRAASYEQL